MAPLRATVTIVSMTPSVASPQPVGTPVSWTVTATDSNPNSLTFQFNVAAGSHPYSLMSDFNIGTLTAGTWTAQPFLWTTIAGEGTYSIEVVAKDFTSGESATQTASFTLSTRITQGAAVVNGIGNPLLALFSAPACAAGSNMRVAFYTGTNAPTYTNWAPCRAGISMNFYIAGMLPTTTYSMYSQTVTNGKVTKGTVLSFTTGALPARLQGGFFPTFTLTTPAPSDDPNPMLLWSFTNVIVPVATDLSGNINWFYAQGAGTLLTRPVMGGTMLTIQNGNSWDSSNKFQQILQEIDLAGNLVHQTNTGIIAHQLVALGVKDATPCGQIAQPPVAGDACLNDFHHDAIRYTINGQPYTAFMAHVEKLFPPGTQGSTTGNNVDVLSEMVIVLNSNWQVVWHYDAFDQLNIQRTAPLGEACKAGSSDCPTNLFLGTTANDWTHANTVDYVASKQNPDSGDFLVSVRNQDLVIRINYNNGAGSCAGPPAASCLAWSMGPPDGLPCPTAQCFTFNNAPSDPWPWFSHQHDVTYANNGTNFTINGLTGPLLTVFDNGNTRYSPPPLGLGTTGCAPSDCNSRGLALIVDEASWTVTPVLLQDLGVKTTALGAAGLLSNGNYSFQTGLPSTQAFEISPNPGTTTGTVVLNIGSVDYSYRAWQMPSLYMPPVL